MPLASEHMIHALRSLFDFILHIDVHLADIIAHYGPWIYAVFFTIIFMKPGLVSMPFPPGDSRNLFILGIMIVAILPIVIEVLSTRFAPASPTASKPPGSSTA